MTASLPSSSDLWRFFERLPSGGAGGIGPLAAAVLVLIVWLVLPRDERRLVRGPLVLLVMYLVAMLGRWLLPEGWGAARYLSLASLFLFLSLFGRGVFLLFVHAVLARRVTFTLPQIVQDIIQIGIYVAVALITLRAAGVEPGSLLATSALLTAVLGLSLQDTLGNMFAGLAIQAERPFEVGDWIEFDEQARHVGYVLEINWRATKLRTLDQIEVTVPNAVLAKSALSNFSKPQRLTRRSAYVVAPYAAPPARVREVLDGALRDVPGVLAEPAPSTVVYDFTERGVQYWVRYFIEDFARREDIAGRVRERVWYALGRAHVPIPPPQRFVELEQRSRDAVEAREVEERQRALSHIDFLHPLSDAALKRLASLAETRLFTPGERIISQGEPGHEMFIVHRGKVDVLFDRGNREVKVAELKNGEFFGEMSVMTGEPRSASVLASGECEVIAVSHAAFQEVLRENQAVLSEMSEILAARHHQLDEQAPQTERAPHDTHRDQRTVLLERIKHFFAVK